MDIKKIEDVFFTDSYGKSHIELLDKKRGYGIVIIELKDNLKFGIPLRSNLKPQNGFTVVDNKGLDFSKSILLIDDSYISQESFIIPSNEYIFIQDNEYTIKRKFTKYVEIYIEGLVKNDANILRKYKFSTLQNYKLELIYADSQVKV